MIWHGTSHYHVHVYVYASLCEASLSLCLCTEQCEQLFLVWPRFLQTSLSPPRRSLPFPAESPAFSHNDTNTIHELLDLLIGQTDAERLCSRDYHKHWGNQAGWKWSFCNIYALCSAGETARCGGVRGSGDPGTQAPLRLGAHHHRWRSSTRRPVQWCALQGMGQEQSGQWGSPCNCSCQCGVFAP